MSPEAKEARNAYMRAYYAKNRESQKAYRREWYKAHKDRAKMYKERFWENKAKLSGSDLSD